MIALVCIAGSYVFIPVYNAHTHTQLGVSHILSAVARDSYLFTISPLEPIETIFDSSVQN